MEKTLINNIQSNLKGEITVPGDKSISHRAIMLGSIAYGVTEIDNFLMGEDCLATIDCFRKMGVKIENKNSKIIVEGVGLNGLKEPDGILDAKNSGTTTRIISGILAGQKFKSTITGDDSLKKRPMKRVISPLEKMGAKFLYLGEEERLPFTVQGAQLKGITYRPKVASAQVKSAILLAALYADCPTTIVEVAQSRNHSELMLEYFGAQLKHHSKTEISIRPNPRLMGQHITVSADISSAAYFMVAGLICEGSDILIKNVNINPTRAGIINVIQDMNGIISLENLRDVCNEDVADIHVKYSPDMTGTTIGGDIIPTLIDEIPVIAVLAAFAHGKTIIKDAEELKVKESNRIDTVVNGLTDMGATIKATNDGMVINGGEQLFGAKIATQKDHRIAMAFSIANLICKGSVILDDANCVSISFPGFYDLLDTLINN
ncbi:MAG: 3-phosphoshikimate 1-carboxyvinyltransferase [Lachnospiraceae bacterium]|nr:3-phosphoshikimate 1-carboxyvinyltransferase [Lachnospiraceae bacterium]